MVDPLIILDRDGVINYESEHFVKSADEWLPLPGALAAIARFTAAGWRIGVATNQSGVARGLFGYHELAAIHARMHAMVAAKGGCIDAVFFCPHGPDDNCTCRKPAPGLYDQMRAYFNHDLRGVPSVGDSARDLAAARAAGAMPILVRTGNGARTEAALPAGHDIDVYDDLGAVATALLG